MRIAAVRHTVLSVPARHRILSSVRDTDHVINVLVEVDTDEGLTGVSYVAGFSPHKARAVCAMLDDLAEAVTGLDALATGAAWDRMWSRSTLAGHAGLSI